MSPRWRLLSYLLALHLALFGLLFQLYSAHPLLVLMLELLLLCSAVGGVYLVTRERLPLDYVRRFQDLLRDGEYASRLKAPDTDELAPLVDLFNQMLGQLYQERLKLGEQRGFLERLLEATPTAVVVFDFDRRISLLNLSASALLKLKEPLGQSLLNANGASPSLLEQLDALAIGASQLLSTADGRRYRAQRGQFIDRGFAREFLLIDELTETLERSERATYEKLVRVLAHEVNNTVAATGSVLDSLLFYRDQLNATDRTDFVTAITAVKQRNQSLGEFIERFTRVVKMPEPEKRPTDLLALLDQTLQLYRAHCRDRGITIQWPNRAPIPLLNIDPQLIGQALMNIVKNAIEAIESAPLSESHHLRIECIDTPTAVQLAIIDSGNQLGRVPVDQLFSAFFSTKKGGQGIGLLFVREVLTRHDCRFRLCAQGNETRFEIEFLKLR